MVGSFRCLLEHRFYMLDWWGTCGSLWNPPFSEIWCLQKVRPYSWIIWKLAKQRQFEKYLNYLLGFTEVLASYLNSPWPLRSRHTSGRSCLNPYGNRGYVFVKVGNVLSERSILIVLLASWCGLRWLMEQPDGSFMPHLPKFQWLFGILKALGVSKQLDIFVKPLSKVLFGWFTL